MTFPHAFDCTSEAFSVQDKNQPFHAPVMAKEVLEALSPKDAGKYLDGTLGLGGHAAEILQAAPHSMLCGLDRDSEALMWARRNLAPFGERARCFHSAFADFETILREMNWTGIDGALLDLGVSSMQLDNGERGFSYSSNALLDMRMDQTNEGISARDLLKKLTYEELKEIISTLGEDPMAGRIARNIISAREKEPIMTTGQLAEIIKMSYPAKWRKSARRHPAVRVFQALRMRVNDELGQLAYFLQKILPWLNAGARLVIISFHSLEDRMVKQTMKKWANSGAYSFKDAGEKCFPLVKILYKKPLTAAQEEIAINPRSRSAKLRAAEKLTHDAG